MPAQAYQKAAVEGAVPSPQRLYCPYRDCQVMLERSAEADDCSDPVDNNRQARCMGCSCPYCKRPFCPNCGITGHHKVRRSHRLYWSFIQRVPH